MRAGWADSTAGTLPQICTAVGKASGGDPAPFRNLHTAEGNWFALDAGPQPLLSASPNPGCTAQRGSLTEPTLDKRSGPRVIHLPVGSSVTLYKAHQNTPPTYTTDLPGVRSLDLKGQHQVRVTTPLHSLCVRARGGPL